MLNFIINKIIGTQNERYLRGLAPFVSAINSLEPKIKALSDEAFRAKTEEFRSRFRGTPTHPPGGYPVAGSGEALDAILPEAFAVVREAARRAINMRHFDVQLIGGMVLHQGKIAEMATGEGKTLVATLSAYLNALTGEGVHIVTVNDYLARRDREWMGPVYEFLGLTVGAIQHDMMPEERKRAYACDITYGTNNEFGFDYLRDNMVVRKEDMVQHGHNYAIVDEVDSILIDEARTPLIISGPAEESTEKYYIADRAARGLRGRRVTEAQQIDAKYKGEDLSKGFDYLADEKAHTVSLTEEGETKAAQLFGVPNLHDIETMDARHHIIAGLRAKEFFRRDVDYVVKDKQVIIVDEFTGRLMPGRRWSDGLHQAVEAKEGLRIERENQTLATITFQNYFRMYKKLAGMTGTAFTEAAEFKHIYKLDVAVIPTNRSLIRTNFTDVIYKTEREKFNAVVKEIKELHTKGRPILVGTISIEKSERLSEFLKREGIPHQVLNAKYHEMEAQIVAQAGRLKAVTIATNMAGRGTDILLGGNVDYIVNDLLKVRGLSPLDPQYKIEREELLGQYRDEVAKEHEEVVSLGGLHIIGTERHEARRIDNQLRGRAGRQGDPGSSRFYVALEDDLMRIFGSGRIMTIMDRLGMEEGQAIEHTLVSRAIETAQKRVEAHNFDIRKHLLEYDTVMNRQREILYEERRRVLMGENLRGHISDIVDEVITSLVDTYVNKDIAKGEWNIAGLIDYMRGRFSVECTSTNLENLSSDDIAQFLYDETLKAFEAKEKAIGPDQMCHLAQAILLHTIDTKWKDHLYAMDNLREGIGLRAYGQREPLIEYQHEGFAMFEEVISRIKEEALEFIFKVEAMGFGRLVSVFGSIPQELLHEDSTGMGMRVQRAQPSSSEYSTEGRGVPTPIRRGSGPQREPPRPQPAPFHREGPKAGRNDPCPCGSGKKYKKCCGK